MTDAPSENVTHHAAQPARNILVMREAGVFAALIVLCIVFALLNPVFPLPVNLLNLLRQISLLGVLAIGATYVLIISEVDLSFGSLYGFDGMLGGMLILQGVTELVAIAITLVCDITIGVLNGAISLVGRISSFITTLGTLYLVRGATLVMSDGMPVSLPHGAGYGPIITYIAQSSQIGGLSNQMFGTEGVLSLDVERERLWLRRTDGKDETVPIEPGSGAYTCTTPVHTFIDLCLGKDVENCGTALIGLRSVKVVAAMLESSKAHRAVAVE